MEADTQSTKSNGASGNAAADPEAREHISYLLAKTKSPRRLHTVERLLQQPGSRVFVPQSEAGSMLFVRLLDLDIVYAGCGRASWRNSTEEALARKQKLESDLHMLNRTLIQFIAEVAVEYGLDTQRMDAAVVTKIRALKAEKATAENETGDRAPAPGEQTLGAEVPAATPNKRPRSKSGGEGDAVTTPAPTNEATA